MKVSFAVFCLINNVSAEVGVWDDTAYCVPGTEIATIQNSMFSLQDCQEYCVTQYEASQDGVNACCDYEGWTSGLSDCTLYVDTDETVPYMNEGAYGNTDYNYYASMNYTANAGPALDEYPVYIPTPGTECVNDDSTGDQTGDTCSMYYDNNYSGCGNWDTEDFTSWNQCCECGGGLGTVVDEASCVNDDSTGDTAGDTCSDWYDSYPDGCGNYDTTNFDAASQCCVCGGGQDYSTGIVEDAVAELCENDDTVTDTFGDTCSSWYDFYPSGCGSYDDSTFSAEDACCVCGGGSFNDIPENDSQPTEAGCVNDDSVGDSFGDTCTGWYDEYTSGCGNYDTADFSASASCCACGGGVYGDESVAPSAPAETCNSDLTTYDTAGDSCTWYDLYGGANCGGTWDDDDFSAVTQCCACGGGDYLPTEDTLEEAIEVIVEDYEESIVTQVAQIAALDAATADGTTVAEIAAEAVTDPAEAGSDAELAQTEAVQEVAEEEVIAAAEAYEAEGETIGEIIAADAAESEETQAAQYEALAAATEDGTTVEEVAAAGIDAIASGTEPDAAQTEAIEEVAADAAYQVAIAAAADDGMTIEESADLPPAEVVEHIIADAVEAGIVAGETGEAPVVTEEDVASATAVEDALVDIAAE